MSSYNNTSIYQASLKFYDQIVKLCNKRISDPLFFNLENQTIKLTSDIAFAIEHQTKEEQDQALLESLHDFKKIHQLSDLALHRKLINAKENADLEEEIRILKTQIEYFISNRPNILILSSLMGQGHISAAKSIKEGLESLYGKDYNVIIIDFVDKIGTFFNKAILKTYESSTKYAPNAYKLFFESTDSKWPVKLLNICNYPPNVSKLKKLFLSYNPTITISTFPVWDYLASLVLKKSNSKKFISIITDSISIHNCWLSGNPDYHIVPNEETAISLRKLGAPEHKIKILGFPVKLNFMVSSNRQEFLKSLDLDPKKFTTLFLPTGAKPAITIKKIKEINDGIKDLNIIIICGRDKELFPKISKKFKNNQNVRIIGWTNQMPEFMKCSDLIVTKAGGATVMECIAAKKPMIITQIIPGQEMGNGVLIKKHNLGIIQKDAKMTLVECIEFIRKHRHTFEKNLQRVSNPEAALKIASFIHEQIQGK
jgi:processive 1,2-diacylglycerol beta-glucosyltransferase